MVQVRHRTDEAEKPGTIGRRVGGEIETVGGPVPDDQRVQTPRQMFIVWLMAAASATTPLIAAYLALTINLIPVTRPPRKFINLADDADRSMTCNDYCKKRLINR